jgi:hypothetical protein
MPGRAQKVGFLAVFLFLALGLANANSIAKVIDQTETPRAAEAQTQRTSVAIRGSEARFDRVGERRAGAAIWQNGCGYSEVCYSTIRAPEPQSLFLVGSGLVTMAAFVRRRFAR